MGKVTVEDLRRIRQQTRNRIGMRDQIPSARVTVHMGDCGIKSGARDVLKAILDEAGRSGRNDIRVFAGDCLGICETEPNVTVETEDGRQVVYGGVDSEKACRIFERHVLNGQIQQEDTVELPAEDQKTQNNQEG